MNPLVIASVASALVTLLPEIAKLYAARNAVQAGDTPQREPADPAKDEGFVADVVGLIGDIATNPRAQRIVARMASMAAAKRA